MSRAIFLSDMTFDPLPQGQSSHGEDLDLRDGGIFCFTTTTRMKLSFAGCFRSTKHTRSVQKENFSAAAKDLESLVKTRCFAPSGVLLVRSGRASRASGLLSRPAKPTRRHVSQTQHTTRMIQQPGTGILRMGEETCRWGLGCEGCIFLLSMMNVCCLRLCIPGCEFLEVWKRRTGM